MRKKVSVVIPVYNQETLLIKALDSIPVREDIEVVVIDDGSTDKTWDNLIEYSNTHDLDIICLANASNKGVSYTINKGLDEASGEYIVLLGSDDYFYTDEFNKIMNELDGTDLVYFNLKVNSGDVWRVDKKSKQTFCGSVKFMRKSFVGDTRCQEERRAGEDWYFYQDLLKKSPTEKFTDLVVKHYNFPREGSLIDLASKGELAN